MTKNPLINALAAGLYIILIVSVVDFGMRLTGPSKSIIVPIVMLSLFTLSAAIMSYLFLLHPLQLYLDNKKKEAVKLFLQTVAVFAVVTALAYLLLVSRVLS